MPPCGGDKKIQKPDLVSRRMQNFFAAGRQAPDLATMLPGRPRPPLAQGRRAIKR
jgi:hypothetical protein